MRWLQKLKRRWLVRRGRWIVGSASITPALPAGTKRGDLLILTVNGREPIAWIAGRGDKKVNLNLNENGELTGFEVENGA